MNSLFDADSSFETCKGVCVCGGGGDRGRVRSLHLRPGATRGQLPRPLRTSIEIVAGRWHIHLLTSLTASTRKLPGASKASRLVLCTVQVSGSLNRMAMASTSVLVTAIAATISPSLWSASHTPLMVPRLNGDTKSVQDLHPLVLDQYLLCSLSSYSSTNCSSDVSKVFVENDGNVARQRHRCGLAGYHFSRVSQAVLLLP
jgi:hypothetical protein